MIYLRVNDTEDWPEALKHVIKAINATPNPGIGFLRPADIQSKYDDPAVFEALREHGRNPYEIEPNWDTQVSLQNRFVAGRSPFQVGNFAFLNFAKGNMHKSTKDQR